MRYNDIKSSLKVWQNTSGKPLEEWNFMWRMTGYIPIPAVRGRQRYLHVSFWRSTWHDRNGMDLTAAEDIKKRRQEYTNY